ncbi:unnamed protein product [Pedinophyceae sp. YPF-701]|nr:unnamed protein product [Pedinophyceae sp. YPF-701]
MGADAQDGKRGWVYRGSSVVDFMFNKRYCVLYKDSLATFRETNDKAPSKVWPLEPCVEVEGPFQKDSMVKAGRSSTLGSLAFRNYERRPLWIVRVKWPRGSAAGPFTLTFGVDGEAEATEWATILRATAEKSPVKPPGSFRFPPMSRGAYRRLNSMGGASDVPSATPPGAPPVRTNLPTTPARHGRAPSAFTGAAGSQSSVDVDGIMYQDVDLPDFDHDDDAMYATGGAKWASIRHVHGINIYHEESDGLGEGSASEVGGAYMVSVVVRGEPHACFASLMETGQMQRTAHLPLVNLCVLSVVDAQSQILSGQLLPPGSLLASVARPRCAVVQRTWRQEADGTYVVLFTAVDPTASDYGSASDDDEANAAGHEPPSFHANVRGATGKSPEDPEERSAFARWATQFGQGDSATQTGVPADYFALGYTIAPLKDRYLSKDGISTESLVTMVLKVDLGGWMGATSRLCRWAPGMMQRVEAMWAEPLLLSILSLRDRVEQDRFVILPFRRDYREARKEYEPLYRTVSLTHLNLTDVTDPALSTNPNAATNPLTRGASRSGTMYLSEADEEQVRKEAHAIADKVGVSELPAVQEHAALPRVSSKDSMASANSRQASMDSAGAPPAGTGAKEFPFEVLEPREHASCPHEMWSSPESLPWRVRGANYLRDKKKYPAGQSMFELVCVDVFECPQPTQHVARFLKWLPTNTFEYLLIVNILVPLRPKPLALTMSFACKRPEVLDQATTFGALFHSFAEGDAEARNKKFKLIPNVPQGSWIIKQAVGSTPVLLGRKVTTHYYRGPNYLEVCVDVTSSSAANTAVRLVQNATKSLMIDMAVLIEGQSDDELPEKIIGHARFDRLDLRQNLTIDPTDESLMWDAEEYLKNREYLLREHGIGKTAPKAILPESYQDDSKKKK